MLGRANKRNVSEDSDEEDGNRDGEELALRAGDVAETHGFRALFSAKEDGALAAAPPFVGQVGRCGGVCDLHPLKKRGLRCWVVSTCRVVYMLDR